MGFFYGGCFLQNRGMLPASLKKRGGKLFVSIILYKTSMSYSIIEKNVPIFAP
jgi:hypothetical protein